MSRWLWKDKAVGVAAVCAALAMGGAAAVWAPIPQRSVDSAAIAPIGEPTLRVELRSWIVAGRGRHLYARIIPPENAPEPIAALADVVEYWSTAQRMHYMASGDPERDGRIAKMPRGVRVRPMLSEPDDRLEAVYEVTASQAMELQRDRMFESRYFLLGPNSTSGLRAAFEAAGLALPQHVIDGRGILGEFPGVDLSAGALVPVDQWMRYGLNDGPEPFPPTKPGDMFLRTAEPVLAPGPAPTGA